MVGYNSFNNVDEFKQYYGLSQINEAKDNKDNKQSPEEGEDEEKAVKTDNDLPVEYAKLNQFGNIFKHIIIFTNDRDTKNNKTLRNIVDACKAIKKDGGIVPQLHIFVAAEVDADEDESEIKITDGDEEFLINKESNLDTLVFSRLGVQGEDECEHIVQLLQDRGFLVLNPVKYAALACDKYETAVLLKNGGIPQPNFTYMTKDILYDPEMYNNAMKEVYEEWDPENQDNNEKLDFVVKILDGHGGTGVFLIDGKRIMAILQTIFAIRSSQSLIIQRKEEADGGDIRVHVLTLRNRQVILAAMKRVKIKSDFRSNVSLGASAEKVKLTPEQEQIALKVAKLSRMPWCAVDIMPLVKGSNPELGDNVVLEMNASPGTDGISDVIGFNFVNILLNELNDPNEFYLQDKIAGFMESISIKFDDNSEPVKMLAKLDTGNGAKASHIEVGEYKITNNQISFTIEGKPHTYEIKFFSHAKTGDVEHNRPVITIPELTLGLRKLKNIQLAVVKNRGKSTNALLNRDALSKMGYVVSSSKIHILTKEMEKVKIV